MALSDYEKEVLAEMEAHLSAADPSLASAMTDSAPENDTASRAPLRFSPRYVALGAILAVIGLAVILGGVSLGFGVWAVLLGVLGFALMVGGILLALRQVPASAAADAPKPAKAGSPATGSFMSRQRDQWDGRGSRR